MQTTAGTLPGPKTTNTEAENQTFGEKGLQHHAKLVLRYLGRRFGGNIVALRPHPVGAGDLVGLHLISERHQALEVEIGICSLISVDVSADFLAAKRR